MVQFVGLLDAQGTVLEINKVALDAVGIELSDVEGKPFWTTFWWQVSDDIRATLRELIARAAQGEFVRWDTPIYGRAGGKETIIIDASLCPVKDEHGTVVFICAEGRDITEKKAQEREIAQKNIELQGLLERVRELDEIRTQFFANVSHELRTPLALIVGPAERLLRSAPALEPDEQRETAQVIVRNARMLLKHVNDLLDISKLEAGKLKIELQRHRCGRTRALHGLSLRRPGLGARRCAQGRDTALARRGRRSGEAPARADESAVERLQVRLSGRDRSLQAVGRERRRAPVRRGFRTWRETGAAQGDLRAFPPGRRRDEPAGLGYRARARDRARVRRDAQGRYRGPRFGSGRSEVPGLPARAASVGP